MKKQKVFKFKKGETYDSWFIDKFMNENLIDYKKSKFWAVTKKCKMTIVLEE